MPPYPNGRAPREALIHRGGNHWLPPGTNAAWDAFVADGKKTYGVTFVITPRGGPDDITNGENGYRFLDTQVTARAKACARGNCAQAAFPGTSNHGIGRAIDVYNWAAIPWPKFVALCKKHGFVPLTVPGERWHIYYPGDPWTVPSGGGEQPFPPTPPKPDPTPLEVIDMSDIRYIRRDEPAPAFAPEWMIVGPTELPHPGYQTTTDVKVAETWGIMFGTEKGDAHFALKAGVYNGVQAEAVRIYRALGRPVPA